MNQVVIDTLSENDWEKIRQIYAEGIATGYATFEVEVPPRERWFATHRSPCNVTARDGPEILGFAALSSISGRTAYAGVAELSVYVAERSRGLGIGSRLLRALIERSEEHGIWSLQAGVLPENEASIALHLRNGFRLIGRRERIARLHGVWRDVLLFERRSSSVAVD